MAFTITNAASKYPTFGIDCSVSISSTTQNWYVTGIQVSNSNPVAELADGRGMTVGRTYYNRDSSNKSYDRELRLEFVGYASTDTADSAGSISVPTAGTVMTVTSTTHANANGSWEVQTCDPSGTNTGYPTFSLTAKWAVTNT